MLTLVTLKAVKAHVTAKLRPSRLTYGVTSTKDMTCRLRKTCAMPSCLVVESVVSV